MKKENVILNKSFDFALQIIVLYKKLVVEKEFIKSKQLLSSGTCIGTYIHEATAAISKRDFIAKISISSKEVTENKYVK